MRAAERYEKGAAGEEATATALRALPADEWTIFHDVRWPERKLANVDHVVVGPPGIFVIDSKNWSGSVTIKGGVLRHNGYRKERAVASAAEAAIAIARLVPDVAQSSVFAALCFTTERPLAGHARDVAVCTTTNVVDLLLTRPPVLSPEQRVGTTARLDALLTGATESRTLAATAPARPRTHLATSSRRRRARPIRFVVAVALSVGFVVAVSKTDLIDRVSHGVVHVVTPSDDQSPDDSNGSVKHHLKKAASHHKAAASSLSS